MNVELPYNDAFIDLMESFTCFELLYNTVSYKIGTQVALTTDNRAWRAGCLIIFK